MQDRHEAFFNFYEMIEKLIDENKIIEALHQVKDALNQDPAHEGLLTIHYVLLIKVGNYLSALTMIDSVLQNNSSIAKEHLNHKAYCLYELGEYARAKDVIKENIKQAPDYMDAQCLYGLILLKLRRTNDAHKVFDSIVRQPLESKDEYTATLYAAVLNGVGEYPAVLNLLNSNKNKNYYRIWIENGNAHLGMKNYVDAKDCFQKAIELNSNAADAYLGLGQTFYALSQYKEAHSFYELAENLRPKDLDMIEGKLKVRALLELNNNKELKPTKETMKPSNVIEIDVPNDNNCLFWSVLLGYLLPKLQDQKTFDVAYFAILGKRNTIEQIMLSDEKIKNAIFLLLKKYDFKKNASLFDNPYFIILCKVLRLRTVEVMTGFFSDEHKQVIADDVNKKNWVEYTRWIKKHTAWGGQPEIMAMSCLIKTSINVYSKGYVMDYPYEGSKDAISLMYARATKKSKLENHYHYFLDDTLYKKIRAMQLTSPKVRSTGLFKSPKQKVQVRENDRIFHILDYYW